MATSTTKLGLTKPDFVDVVDISELNTNADAIDAAVGATIVTSATRPASPWAGQIIYETDTESSFVWTGSAWIASGGGGASVTVSETAPVSPTEGDLWLNSTEAKMYVYYDDGTSAQWVAAVGGTVPQQGKILQVVSTVKTDTFSASLGGGVWSSNVTGLEATITPSSATSKILVLCHIAGSRSGNYPIISTRVMRDATPIGVGASPGSRQAVTSIFEIVTASEANMGTTPISYLDSPATTSAITYGIQLNGQAAGTTTTVYINRSATDTDNGSFARSVSTITLLEVAA